MHTVQGREDENSANVRQLARLRAWPARHDVVDQPGPPARAVARPHLPSVQPNIRPAAEEITDGDQGRRRRSARAWPNVTAQMRTRAGAVAGPQLPPVHG